MKKFIIFLPVLALLVSCNLLDGGTISSTDVGGDSNLDMNVVGTKVSTNVTVGTRSSRISCGRTP